MMPKPQVIVLKSVSTSTKVPVILPDLDDPIYRSIARAVRNDLILKTVDRDEFGYLQLVLIGLGAPVDHKDEMGESLLHRAVRSLNYDGVVKLLENHANSTIKDSDGQTPLHRAVLEYCQVTSDLTEDDADARLAAVPAARWSAIILKGIVQELLAWTSKSGLKSSRDRRDNLPQDFLHDTGRGGVCDCLINGDDCCHNAIRRLFRDHQPRASRKAVASEIPWATWCPPRGREQVEACRVYRAIVAEFYGEDSDPHWHDPHINELIYTIKQGPVQILSKLSVAQETIQVKSRWIHLPANNVRIWFTPLSFKR